MTDTTTSREEFEKWASQKFGQPLRFIVGQRSSSGDRYYTEYLDISYKNWKEIRGSIVLTLPDPGHYDNIFQFAEDVNQVLRSAGLTVKGD